MRHRVFFIALGLFMLSQTLSAISIPDDSRMIDGAAAEENMEETEPEDYRYYANPWDRLLAIAQKRSCIGIDRRCDNRPNGCCYNSACRCSVFGTNCRCQRMGLFQIWGRK